MKTEFEIVTKECQALVQTGVTGKRFLDPHRILEWASEHPESALYRQFEWDNTKAAQEWRLQQARQLIARIVIYEEPHPGETIEYRQFTSVPVETGGRMIQVPMMLEDVLADPEERRKWIVARLTDAYGELRNFPQVEELEPARRYLQRQIDKFSNP